MSDQAEPIGAEGVETSLAECPPGLFWAGDTLGMKSEYEDDSGRIEAFIVESGEVLWGHAPQTTERQRAMRVIPISHDTAIRALATCTPDPKAAGVEREAIARIIEPYADWDRPGGPQDAEAEHRQSKALTKADAILALRAVDAAPGGGVPSANGSRFTPLTQGIHQRADDSFFFVNTHDDERWYWANFVMTGDGPEPYDRENGPFATCEDAARAGWADLEPFTVAASIGEE